MKGILLNIAFKCKDKICCNTIHFPLFSLYSLNNVYVFHVSVLTKVCEKVFHFLFRELSNIAEEVL